jgi:hypothetical protein
MDYHHLTVFYLVFIFGAYKSQVFVSRSPSAPLYTIPPTPEPTGPPPTYLPTDFPTNYPTTPIPLGTPTDTPTSPTKEPTVAAPISNYPIDIQYSIVKYDDYRSRRKEILFLTSFTDSYYVNYSCNSEPVYTNFVTCCSNPKRDLYVFFSSTVISIILYYIIVIL